MPTVEQRQVSCLADSVYQRSDGEVAAIIQYICSSRNPPSYVVQRFMGADGAGWVRIFDYVYLDKDRLP